MKQSSGRWMTGARVFASALLTVAGLGCSGRGPTTPDVGATSGQVSDPGIATAGPEGAASTFQSAPNWYTVASKSVKPLFGGVVAGSRYKVTLPPLSLSQTTTIAIREYSPNVIDFELLPHGTQFLLPVTVDVDYSGTSLDPASPDYQGGLPVLLWLNASTGLWELVPGVNNPLTKKYTVLLTHFSRYAVSSQGTAEW